MPQEVEQFIGTPVNLFCSADGFPAPDIMWTFGGMMFEDETVNSTTSTYAESTIVITKGSCGKAAVARQLWYLSRQLWLKWFEVCL